jgi:sortase (surface protein transpeptidase)
VSPKLDGSNKMSDRGYIHRPSQYMSATDRRKALRKKIIAKQALPKKNKTPLLVNTKGSLDGLLGQSAKSAQNIIENSSQKHRVARLQHTSPQQIVERVAMSQQSTAEKYLDNTTGQDAQPSDSEKEVQPKKSFFNTQRLLTGMAAFLFVAGGVVTWTGLMANKDVKVQAKTLAAQVEEVRETGNTDNVVDVPDEESPPPDIDAYATKPTYPKIISIPSIESRGRVTPLGLKSSGQMESPYNIYDAGWYDKSSTPGSAGATLIDGHVSGPSKPGIFKNLEKLAAGAKIEIERGDGKKYSYTVIKVETVDVDKVNMAKLLVPITAGSRGLNLITCGGHFDASSNKYLQRTIVYATLDQ